MSEHQAYQEMFSEKNCFLARYPELDKPLWKNMKEWLNVDMTQTKNVEDEAQKKVADTTSTTYSSILKKHY